jgi:RecA-family ATPase
MIAAGGTGKTTLLLYEAIHIVLGRTLYGREVKRPGPVVVLSAEDDRSVMIARLREIAKELELTDEELKQVKDGVRIEYVGGENFRLCQVEKDTVCLSPQVQQVIDLVAPIRPVMFVIDPAVSFGVGEQRVNDAEQGLIQACRKMRDSLPDCVIRLVHHTGKSNSRDKTTDQYSGRGGSAMADGARMVHVMQPMEASTFEKEVGHAPEQGEDGVLLALPKMSYCQKQDNIYILRQGFRYAHVERDDGRRSGIELTEAQLEQIKARVGEMWASEKAEDYPRKDARSPEWFGHVVAAVLGLDGGKGVNKTDLTSSQKETREKLSILVSELLTGTNAPFMETDAKTAKGRRIPCVRLRGSYT